MKKTIIGAGALVAVGVIIFIFGSRWSDTSNPQQAGIGSTSTESNVDYQVDPSDMVQVTARINGIPKFELTPKEKEGLIQMREEEKLAHDVYVSLGEKWGVRIFSNIASSEQTHTEAVKALLDKYGITDPAAGKREGEFTSSQMQKLYTDLVAKGTVSRVDALMVGATIEDLDIHDLDVLKASTTKEDILLVYNNLQKGSRNHTRAFVKNLQMNGSTYAPQFISQADFDAILNSPQERGPQM